MCSGKAAALFDGWEAAMISSCLQGHMGSLIMDDENNPVSAMIDIGDFCFLAGEPNAALLNTIRGSKLLIPKDQPWEVLIEGVFGDRVNRFLRYATKKEPGVFDKAKLRSFVNALDPCYEIQMIDSELYEWTRREKWSVDLCSQFEDARDYQRHAFGVAILHRGELVAGASPYAVYHGGIEIEIDTKPAHRRKGLATACGAKLILECLKRGVYPSWDAHDLRSLALAEKLGYQFSHAYVTFELTGG